MEKEKSNQKEKRMQTQMRVFTPDDYPAVIEVFNAARSNYPTTMERMRAEDGLQGVFTAFQLVEAGQSRPFHGKRHPLSHPGM